QLDKARPLIEGFISGCHKHLGPESLVLAGGLGDIGLVLVRIEQHVEAEKHLRQSTSIREKKEPDVWSTFNTKSMLGAALLGQKNYDKAEPLLLGGYQGMKQREDKIPAKSKVRLTETLEHLVQLYDAWNKPVEAAKWRKELEMQKKVVEKTVPTKAK